MVDPEQLDSKALVELAKAAQEWGKPTSKALDLTSEAFELVGRVVGPTADAIGGAVGILSDQIAFFRTMRMNRFAELFWAASKSVDCHLLSCDRYPSELRSKFLRLFLGKRKMVFRRCGRNLQLVRSILIVQSQSRKFIETFFNRSGPLRLLFSGQRGREMKNTA